MTKQTGLKMFQAAFLAANDVMKEAFMEECTILNIVVNYDVTTFNFHDDGKFIKHVYCIKDILELHNISIMPTLLTNAITFGNADEKWLKRAKEIFEIRFKYPEDFDETKNDFNDEYSDECKFESYNEDLAADERCFCEKCQELPY
jgi:hypothetical protein